MNAIVNIFDYEMFPEELKDRKELCRELLKFKDKMIHFDIESISIISDRFLHQKEQKDSPNIFKILVIADSDEVRERTKKAFKNSYELNSICEIVIVSKKQIIDFCLQKEFNLIDTLCLSFVLYDREFLSILKLVNMHKLIFNKSIGNKSISYVVVGSFSRLDYKEESDIDTLVIVDDTMENADEKYFLKESLRKQSYELAENLRKQTKVYREFSPNIYFLTEFWEAIYNGHPIIFTFLRDGFPLLDNGTYLSWKKLLKEGKFKYNREFIEQMFEMSNKIVPMISNKMTELVVEDMYWGAINRIQAILILKGNESKSVDDIKNIIKRKELSDEIDEDACNFLLEIINIFNKHKHGQETGLNNDKVILMIEKFKIFITATEHLKTKYKYYS